MALLQVQAVHVGDTLRVFVKLNDFYSTSNGNVVVDSTHWLLNQRHEVVFAIEKRSMFPIASSQSSITNIDLQRVIPTFPRVVSELGDDLAPRNRGVGVMGTEDAGSPKLAATSPAEKYEDIIANEDRLQALDRLHSAVICKAGTRTRLQWYGTNTFSLCTVPAMLLL